MFRCAVQCENKIKSVRTEIKHWRKEEDDKLLKILESTSKKDRKDWDTLQYYFPGRTGIAIKTRYYVLMEKLIAANPYENKMSWDDLIREKNAGRINISSE